MIMTPSSNTLERFTCVVSFRAKLQEASEVPEACETLSSFSLVEEKDRERSSSGMESSPPMCPQKIKKAESIKGIP
jgi:hypothetical protein